MTVLLDLAVRATVLLTLAALAAAALHRGGASAAMRHAPLALGIGALLALPLMSLALPPLEILPAIQPAQGTVALASAPAVAEPAPDPVHWGWFGWGVYSTILALLLLRVLVGRLRLARLWRSSAAEPWLQHEVDALARAAGIGRSVRLRLAPGPAMPMTWGTVSPKLVLPADALSWTAERRRFVLLHELAHVARCDSLATTAAALACALYWFHPAVWLAAARMRTEQEHAADDRVLSSGAPALPYARDLLALASPAALPALAMARPSQLEQRLTAIVAPRRRRRSGRTFVLGAGLVTLGSTMLVAAAAPHAPPMAPLAPLAPLPPQAAAAPRAAPLPAIAGVPALAAPRRSARHVAIGLPPPPAPAPLAAPATPAAAAIPVPPVAPAAPTPPPAPPAIPAIAPIPPIAPIPGAAAVPPVPPTPATATTPGMPGLPGRPGVARAAGK